MIHILLTLIVVGVVLYLIQLIPMDATMAQVIRVVVILCAVLWVVQSLGLLRGIG